MPESVKNLLQLGKGDARCSLNWSTRKKLVHSAVLELTTFTACYSLQVFGARSGVEHTSKPPVLITDIKRYAKEMWPSYIALALIAGPITVPTLYLSEKFGHKAPLCMMLLILGSVNAVLAIYPNAISLTPSDFAVPCGFPPLWLTYSGAIGDIWSRESATPVMAYLIVCSICNLVLPLWLLPSSASFAGWQQQYGLCAAACFALAVVNVLFLTESYWPVVLKRSR